MSLIKQLPNIVCNSLPAGTSDFPRRSSCGHVRIPQEYHCSTSKWSFICIVKQVKLAPVHRRTYPQNELTRCTNYNKVTATTLQSCVRFNSMEWWRINILFCSLCESKWIPVRFATCSTSSARAFIVKQDRCLHTFYFGGVDLPPAGSTCNTHAVLHF